MSRHQYVILTRAAEGREDEFDIWYDQQHLGDVVQVEGVVSARRFRIDWQKATDLDVPQWRSLAIYEIESDDPQAVVAAIAAAADTDAMPLSDALVRKGMLRFLTEEVTPGSQEKKD